MLKDESTRKKFVDDSVNFLQKFEFDGLDLDFECKIRLNLAFKKNIPSLMKDFCLKKILE